MNRYECKKCGRNVTAPRMEDTVNMLCCSGDTPVTFHKVNSRVIVPVTKLPPDPSTLKPLPPSVPLPPLKPAATIVPAKK